jgi:hypothetical protein
MYFLKYGLCGYVLPKYNNAYYIKIGEGNHFGLIDIIGSLLEGGHEDFDNWINYKDNIKRQFTIMALQNVELLSFSITDLNKMKMEFFEAYNSIFSNQYKRLDRTLKIKLKAMKYCQEFYIKSKKKFKRRDGVLKDLYKESFDSNNKAF